MGRASVAAWATAAGFRIKVIRITVGLICLSAMFVVIIQLLLNTRGECKRRFFCNFSLARVREWRYYNRGKYLRFADRVGVLVAIYKCFIILKHFSNATIASDNHFTFTQYFCFKCRLLVCK